MYVVHILFIGFNMSNISNRKISLLILKPIERHLSPVKDKTFAFKDGDIQVVLHTVNVIVMSSDDSQFKGG